MAGAVSLFLRILVFRTVASAFFPLVWQLWFSIGVMLFGTFAYWETVQHRLPNHRIIYRYMPTGLLLTVMMLFIGQQASKLLAIWQPDPGQHPRHRTRIKQLHRAGHNEQQRDKNSADYRRDRGHDRRSPGARPGKRIDGGLVPPLKPEP